MNDGPNRKGFDSRYQNDEFYINYLLVTPVVVSSKTFTFRDL